MPAIDYPFLLKGEMGKKCGNYSKQAKDGKCFEESVLVYWRWITHSCSRAKWVKSGGNYPKLLKAEMGKKWGELPILPQG